MTTTWNFLVTRFVEEMSYVFLSAFFKTVIYTFVAASISQFLTAATKFSNFSSNEIRLLCFLSLC